MFMIIDLFIGVMESELVVVYISEAYRILGFGETLGKGNWTSWNWALKYRAWEIGMDW